MSNKVVIGSIPKEICYTFSSEIEANIGCKWDIDFYDKKTVREKVLPTFVSDNSDKKMLASAKKWADSQYFNKKKAVSQTVIVNNEPIKNIRIFSLEERGNGGRAYKVVIDKYYVDLREDVLIDLMLKVGIAPGGILRGEYIWTKVGSQMKLVRVGSELHKLILEFHNKKDIKPIGKNDLKIGGVYQGKKKNKAIFIGYVGTTIFSLKEKVPYYKRKFDNFNFKLNQVKKAMLFYEIPDYMSVKQGVKNLKAKDYYFFEIKKSHTYIEKIDQVEIPDDLIFYLRSNSLKEIKESILEYTGHKKPKDNRRKIDNSLLEENIKYCSEYLNLYPYDGKKVEVFDIKKYLIFS